MKISYVLILLVLVFILLSGCTSSPQSQPEKEKDSDSSKVASDSRDLDEISKSASDAYENENWTKAVLEYTAILNKISIEKLDVDDIEMANIYLARGMAYYNLNKKDEAAKDFAKAAKYDPTLASQLGIDTTVQVLISEKADPQITILNEETIPKFTTQKTYGSLTLASATTNSTVNSVVNSAKVVEVTEKELNEKFSTVRSSLSEKYDLTGIGFSIEADIENSFYLGDTLYVKKILPADIVSKMQGSSVGAIYYDGDKAYYEKAIFDQNTSTVILPITHLSWRELIFGKPANDVEDIIQRQATEYGASKISELEESLVKGVEDNLEKLGLNESTKAKIFLKIQANKDKIGEILNFAAGDDTVAIEKNVSTLFGKLIVDSFDDEKELEKVFGGKTLKTLVDKYDLVEGSASEVMKGNYFEVVTLIANDIASESAMKKTLDLGIESWKAMIKVTEDKRYDELYEAWKQEGRKDDFWNDTDFKDKASFLYRQYANQYSTRYGSGCYRGADDSDKIKQCINNLFSDKLKQETASKEEETKMRAFYKNYKDKSIWQDMKNRMRKERGSSVSDGDVLDFFMKKARLVQKDLMKLGYETPINYNSATGSIFFSSEMIELLTAYTAGGDEQMQKAYKNLPKYIEQKNKTINLKKVCAKDSDCKTGEVCTKGKCVKKTVTSSRLLPGEYSVTLKVSEDSYIPGIVKVTCKNYIYGVNFNYGNYTLGLEEVALKNNTASGKVTGGQRYVCDYFPKGENEYEEIYCEDSASGNYEIWAENGKISGTFSINMPGIDPMSGTIVQNPDYMTYTCQ